MPNLLAIDLGAESGRAMLARWGDERVTLEELHRFANVPVQEPDGLRWDLAGLLGGVERALAAAAERGIALDCVAVDTWGVDYGLLDANGELLGAPFHYREPRTDGMIDVARRRVPDAA